MAGTPAIKQIQAAIVDAGFNVRGSPVVVKRKIAKTNLWSQHSYGNAIDYYGTGSELERLYQALSAAKSSGQLPVATLCYNRRGGCTTAHTDHLHVDGKPHYKGTPGTSAAGPSGAEPGATDSGGNVLLDAAGDVLAFNLNPIGSLLGGGVTSITEPFQVAASVAQAAFNPATWLRVLWFVGGVALTGAGAIWIAREFGAPIPTVRGVAELTPVGNIASKVAGG